MARERSNPGTLSRQRIIEVALQISEREGPEALSMRRIAAELGTGAMSLYNHVPDKAALLEGLAEHILADVELPADAPWDELSRAWASSLRATLLAHLPVVAAVVSAYQARPLLATSQALVDALVRIGVADEDAKLLMRVLGRFVSGSVTLDAATIRAGASKTARLDQVFEVGLEALLDGLRHRLPSLPSTPAPSVVTPGS